MVVLRASVYHLVVKEKLPGVVALEQEVEVVQHGRVVEHVIHDFVTEQSTELKSAKGL